MSQSVAAPRAGTSAIDVIAKLFAVVAVLLPVSGALTRSVAYAFDRMPAPVYLAADPTSLVSIAVFDLTDVLVILAAALVTTRVLISSAEHGSWLSTVLRRIPRTGAAAATTLVGLAILVFVVRYTVIPMTLAAVLLVAYWYRIGRRGEDLTFSRLWPSTAMFVVFSAAVGGLSGVTVHAAYLEFAPTSGSPDGYYAEVGRAANLVYLRSCGQPLVPTHHAVDEDQVTRVLLSLENRMAPPGGRTLWDLIRGEPLELGVRFVCPLDPTEEPRPRLSARDSPPTIDDRLEEYVALTRRQPVFELRPISPAAG